MRIRLLESWGGGRSAQELEEEEVRVNLVRG